MNIVYIMGKFELVNPIIKGQFDPTFEGAKPIDAAKKYWDEFAGGKYITNNVPQTMFSLMDESKKLHHFLVNEGAKGSNSKFADYTIQQINVKMDPKQEDEFKKQVAIVHKKIDAQSGGKRKSKSRRKRYIEDDSSSSSSDDDDIIRSIQLSRRNDLITYYWFASGIYADYVDTVFIPTFVAPLYPYIEIAPRILISTRN